MQKILKNKNNTKQKTYQNKKSTQNFGDITYTEKTRAVIKIEDGCNNFCSYCIIPYARGRVRSRKIENIICEIHKVANMGIKEIVLTGIQIASYGIDLRGKVELIDLLEEINKVNRYRQNKITVQQNQD